MSESIDSKTGLKPRTMSVPDVVFDFSGIDGPDLYTICVVLTARMLEGLEDRRVWLHALPEPTWRLMGALGLQRFFEVLPVGSTSLN